LQIITAIEATANSFYKIKCIKIYTFNIKYYDLKKAKTLAKV